LEAQLIENPSYQQLSTMLASVMAEFLEVKDKLPELERLQTELDDANKLIQELQTNVANLARSGLYKDWTIYYDLSGQLMGSVSGGWPIPQNDEEYMLKEGAVMVTIGFANSKGWPL
jgi:hypothetical protein